MSAFPTVDEASSCLGVLVTDFDGALFCPAWRDALWASLGSSRQRHRDRGGASSDEVKRACEFRPNATASTRRPLPNGRGAARRGSADRPETTCLNSAVDQRRKRSSSFRQHTRARRLPDALQATIPHLTRSSLHRYRSGTASRACRRSRTEGAPKRKFKAAPERDAAQRAFSGIVAAADPAIVEETLKAGQRLGIRLSSTR